MSDLDETLSVRARIDAACDAFERRFGTPTPQSVEEVLQMHHDLDPAELLRDLIPLEVRLRQQRGEAVDADDYRQRFPEQGPLIAEIFGGFPEQSEPECESTVQGDSTASDGQTIGPFKILQQIGQGGMGQVYMAEQTEPVRRRVALKIIKTETPTKEVLARFEAERQALAMMDHQNIAKVLDAGITEDGRPYFAMELVRGIPITEYCDKNKLRPGDRLELFVQTCRAIQHAHQKGIIHRDIKPSNVLVTLYDGKAVAKVIDFGLAKALQEQIQLTNRTMFTQFGQIVGTLAYMSPEQAEMNTMDVDTRTDVYSLGVVMYELLTGSTPLRRDQIKNEAFDRVLALIRESDTPRPSTRLSESGDAIQGISAQRQVDPKRLSFMLRGELDWIAVKALEKDRARRYETPSALADDIERYLRDDPVTARPPSLGYRLKKSFRRHKGVFISVSLVLVALLAGLAGTITMWRRATMAEKAALAKADEAIAESARATTAEATARLEAEKARDAAAQAEAAETAAKRDRDRAKSAEEQAKQEAALARAVTEFLTRDLLSLPELRSDPDLPLREALELAAGQLDSRFEDNRGAGEAIKSAIGVSFYSLGQYSTAKAFLEESTVRLREQLGTEHREYATALFNLGVVCAGLGEFERAEAILTESIDIQRTALGENHPDVARASESLAQLYVDVGNYARAESLLNRAAEIWKLAVGESHPRYATCLNRLAMLRVEMGQFEDAELLFKEALDIFNVRPVSTPEYADVLFNLADMYSRAGDFASANTLFRNAIEIRETTLGPHHPDYLESLMKFGAWHSSMGDSNRGDALLTTALSGIRQSLGDDHPLYARCLLHLGESAVSIRDFQSAESYFTEAAEVLAAAVGDRHPTYASAIQQLARHFASDEQLDRATELTERALQIREVVNGPTHPEYGILLIDYGDLLRLLGRHQEAGTKLEEASVVLANSVGTQHPEYARCLLVMGELHVNNGEPAAAAVPVIEAASIALEVLKSGAIVQSERQQQLSFEKYQPFLSAILSLSLNFRDTAETTPDQVLEEVWKWKSLVLRRLYASRLAGNDEQFLNLTTDLQQVTRRLARIVQSEPSSSDVTKTDANAPTESDEHARWRARFEECQLLREALEAKLSAANAEFRGIQQPLTTGEVQAFLSDDAVLLEFIVYDDVFDESGTTELGIPHRSLAVGIVRKSRDPVFVELGPVEPILTATEAFLNPLLAHTSADSESEARALVAARNLRQLLWEPIESHLDGVATVVLSVDSFLGRLPFNAIPGRQAGTYLIEDFEIVTVPYAQFLRPQAGGAHDLKRKSGLLVVGGVEYGSPSSEQLDVVPSLKGQIRGRQQSPPAGKWITLPGTRREIDAIAELYGQQFGRESSVHILTGSAATSENFTRLAPQYRTLHLATHAYFGQPFAPETPPSQLLAESTPTLLSGIVFAGANSDSEGILYAGDVQAMDLQGTDLTVLSGCETSQGVTAAGAGVIGLQRAFHLAGVRTVVGSLWRVDDRATQRLMERFYRNLWMSRMEKGEALRDAQLWLLNNPEVLLETPATRGPRAVSSSISGPPKKLSPLPPADSSAAGSRPDPFYWAAFQLSGDWQ